MQDPTVHVLVNGEHSGALKRLEYEPRHGDGVRARVLIVFNGLCTWLQIGPAMTVQWPLAGLTWRGIAHTVTRTSDDRTYARITEIDFREVTDDDLRRDAASP